MLISVMILIIIVACDPDFFKDGCHSHIKIDHFFMNNTG